MRANVGKLNAKGKVFNPVGRKEEGHDVVCR